VESGAVGINEMVIGTHFMMVKLSSGEASRWDLAVDLRGSMGGGSGPWDYLQGYL